jgi:hypothetical protein
MNKLRLPVSIALAALAVGCGANSASRNPNPAGIPLIPGARVVTEVHRCDRGANPYCAVQMVVVGDRYPSSAALLDSERKQLVASGWSLTDAQTGDERAADSPGHKLRLTFATAALDLKDVDLGWIQRSPVIGRSLSRTMFNRQSAMSLMLETGDS